MLMSPHLAGAADTSLGLIHYEWYFVVDGNLSQSLVEVRSGHLVFESSNWLNYDCSNIFLRISSCLHNVPDFIEAAVLLSSVLVLELSHWVLHLWERCSGPVIGGNFLEINS